MGTGRGELTIGELSERAGVSPATLRYYERLGLLMATRTAGNQRRYPRHILRRLAFVAAGQRVGLTLSQILGLLAQLPQDRAPSQQEWTRLSTPWQQLITDRINELRALQDTLDGCIGCGCLSLTRCALFNPQDIASAEGSGSRWLRKATDGSASKRPTSKRPISPRTA